MEEKEKRTTLRRIEGREIVRIIAEKFNIGTDKVWLYIARGTGVFAMVEMEVPEIDEEAARRWSS